MFEESNVGAKNITGKPDLKLKLFSRSCKLSNFISSMTYNITAPNPTKDLSKI